MKTQILVLILAAFMISCAHSPKPSEAPTGTTAGANPNVGQEFIKGISSQSTRVLDAGTCPMTAVQIKASAWRDQLKAVNACVLKQRWAMVETLGNQMAQTEQLAPWGAYYLSLAAESRKELPRAMWMVELALKKAPQSGLLVYQQGRLQWVAGDHSAAQKSLVRALVLDKRLVDAQLLLAQMALANNDNTEAGQRFQAALDVEPRYLPALLGSAEVSIRVKDTKGALTALSQAILHVPSSTRARVRQAQVIETMEKNMLEALNAYRRIRTMEREHKLDVAVEMDLDGKIRELEGVVKQQQAPKNELSLREPADNKKGPK